MATQKSTALPAHPSTGDHDLHHDQDEAPHVCNDGWITLGQIVIDPETGEEREEFALYLCRRCAERSYGVESTARAGVSFEAPALDHEERKK